MQSINNITHLLNLFIVNLKITFTDRKILLAARKAIRQKLRQKFNEAFPDKLRIICTQAELQSKIFTKVKFLTQGSYQYKTINLPNQTPDQQMDLDDGIYLQIINRDDYGKPEIDALFSFIEKSLKDLADASNWEIYTKKATCVRILLKNKGKDDDKHIDLPIYSVLDLDSLVATASASEEKYRELYQGFGFSQYYARVDGVLLAHREQVWLESDPRKFMDWVIECDGRFKKSFIYISRILKAWRDTHWKESSWTSICLMAMVAKAMEELDYHMSSLVNIDKSILLFKVVEILARDIDNEVADPTNPDKRLDEKISENERKDIECKLKALVKDLLKVMYEAGQVKEKSELLANQFGKFFPTKALKEDDSKLAAVVPTISPIKPFYASKTSDDKY